MHFGFKRPQPLFIHMLWNEFDQFMRGKNLAEPKRRIFFRHFKIRCRNFDDSLIFPTDIFYPHISVERAGNMKIGEIFARQAVFRNVQPQITRFRVQAQKRFLQHAVKNFPHVAGNDLEFGNLLIQQIVARRPPLKIAQNIGDLAEHPNHGD